MKNAANAHTILPEESVLIMYSGGLDSTVAATQMARRFRRVVLMTIDYPFTIGLKNATRNTEKLKIAFPHCSITHHIMDGKDIRRRIWSDFCQDYYTFCKGGAASIICMGCKIAMTVQAMILCFQEGIGHISNGMTRSQVAHPHCMPRVVNRFADFMAEYNIIYINDVYDMPLRADEETVLHEYGLEQGLRIGASSITHQPRCFLGPYKKLWLAGWPAREEDMVKYFDSKRPVMREILSSYSEGKEEIHGNPALRTFVDESFHGEHTHEFGPLIDKAISRSLTPIWLISKLIFWLGRHKRP